MKGHILEERQSSSRAELSLGVEFLSGILILNIISGCYDLWISSLDIMISSLDIISGYKILSLDIELLWNILPPIRFDMVGLIKAVGWTAGASRTTGNAGEIHFPM